MAAGAQAAAEPVEAAGTTGFLGQAVARNVPLRAAAHRERAGVGVVIQEKAAEVAMLAGTHLPGIIISIIRIGGILEIKCKILALESSRQE
jgi:hypothetical protein